MRIYALLSFTFRLVTLDQKVVFDFSLRGCKYADNERILEGSRREMHQDVLPNGFIYDHRGAGVYRRELGKCSLGIRRRLHIINIDLSGRTARG